jgi:hypothetical protein
VTPAAPRSATSTSTSEKSELEAAIDALRPLAGTAHRAEVLERLEECRRIWRLKLAPEASAADAPLLVVLAGGTNVGKTTLLDALAGAEVARPTPVARGTKAAVLYVHEDRAASFRRGGFLPGYERRPLRTPDEPNEDGAAGALLLATHARADLAPLALADSPDIDSVFGPNRRVAWDLLYAADAVVFVASEEKYNDEVCVAFLERALRHGKALIALLNKSGAPEAEADFRDHVVPGAAARAGAGGEGASDGKEMASRPASDAPSASLRPEARLAVLTVPYVAGTAAQRIERARAASGPVAERLAAWAAEAEAIRAAARAGAGRALADEAGRAVQSLRREAEWLARYRAEVRGAAEAAARAYRAALPALPIFEFDRVFRLLAEALKVPLLDDFYARLRALGRPIGEQLSRALGLPAGGPGARELAERDRRDLEQARVRLGEALAAVRALPDRYPPDVADALRAAVVPSPAADALFELDGAYAESLSREAERWVDDVLRELHAKLRASPGTVAIAKAIKGALRAASMTVALVAVGHVGLEDLLIAPLVDLLVKLGVEKAVDRATFASYRDRFYDARAAVFARLVEERAGRLALGGLAGGASAEAIARLERAVAAASGFRPSASGGDQEAPR